jgi:adenylate cyclase
MQSFVTPGDSSGVSFYLVRLGNRTLRTHNDQSIGDRSKVQNKEFGNRENFVDHVGRKILEQPIWFVVVVLLALVLLPLAVWLDLTNVSNAALTRQANDLNSMISEIRSYYARNVIGRILDNDGVSKPVHNYEEIKGGIPIPATLSIELGNVIGNRDVNIRYRFVSDQVFTNRAPHQLDAFEIYALQSLRTKRTSQSSVTEISGSLLRRKIRMAVPVKMGTACVACHNSHPQSPKRDWRVGDVRGIQSITLEQPIAANIFSFKFLLIYLFGAGAFGLTFATLQWRQARRFEQMNTELEETNSFLASISMKISKYLSPQVYKSLFSGERDAIISTERKKLTIFFSDIEDFTTTTERLQPEELTVLLNEYFTEMAAIAQAHGATVDKFIGDAILGFFGDPETKGTREDAVSCLEMAIAMQKRMKELRVEWLNRGIEKPLRARIGINTGFCNVGNFGSEDRMDYTIIGAEANLAARLQAIVKPGGIAMSYETYALVEDRVKAHPLDPINLKGISRNVVPYVVDAIFDEKTKDFKDIFEKKTDRLNLQLDFTGLDDKSSEALEDALNEAFEELRKRRGISAQKST